MVDVILQAVERDAPKLKDCLPAIGALKHLKEWHSAQITIAANDSKGYAVHFRSTNKVTLVLCLDILKENTETYFVLHIYSLQIHRFVFYYCLRRGIADADACPNSRGKQKTQVPVLMRAENKSFTFL